MPAINLNEYIVHVLLQPEYIVVSFGKLDSQKFYNCQFWAPSFWYLAQTMPTVWKSQGIIWNHFDDVKGMVYVRHKKVFVSGNPTLVCFYS